MKLHPLGASIVFLSLAAWLAIMPRPALAQDEEAPAPEAPAEEAPEPQTTADPEIPVDQLELLLQPLTKDELVVEADAWRDLLKQKVSQISSAEIAVKRQNEQVEESDAQTETAKAKTEAVQKDLAAVKQKTDEVAQDAAEAGPDEAEEVSSEASAVAAEADAVKTEADSVQAEAEQNAEAAQQQKEELLEDLPTLREQKTALIDRVNAVLDALETKGGDVEEYRTYVTAVSGINIDTSDASATWTAITGWLTSEQGGLRWVYNILKFLGILLAAYFISKILYLVTYRATGAWPQASNLLRDFLSRFVQQAVLFLGLIAGLAALEVNIGPMLAAIGAAGLVVGLALQDTLSNFASGLLMLAYRPFDVGEVIEAAGVMGKVESMNMVSTHIKTFDNRHMVVPNSQIWGGIITNASTSHIRRVDLTFSVGYDDDLAKAQEILERLVREHPKVLDDPEPMVKLNELGESSIDFICWPWCQSADYGEVKWGLLRAVKDEFDRNGISIPFPQRDIHVYQTSPAAEASVS
ncbi:mechanosensitive ion channel family protein [Tautonia marina]|uniref:mechanosensitive ion channel family protein n=1 Tax=Tautonia marina TaxID=2653855 RepID=UPI0012610777|nr:mechanosensitive ion channel family protein [Tautonia marina]